MKRRPTTPGKMLLEEFLEPAGITQVALAGKMRVPLGSPATAWDYEKVGALIRAGALQLGGLIGADGNGVFAGLGFQPVGLVEGTRRTSLTYAFGLWLRAVHTTRGDRIELGLDLLQLPWLVHL